MLEVKNLRKTYITKGDIVTKALDDVSIRFPETGMVFLLGKSGSGKSTLLNVCGGLDTCDSGEILVMGKSSLNFTKSDFDAYRNTFIGFIFQEYNILDEFSVEDNIALALELQGKPKDKDKIAEILKMVDLDSFAKRKPNTLSGGQKQRIAIARALIKEPQIIMADEPTGALDSATGKQVLDTLKKLSLHKLVIIVSHDQEFANQYADRIIELKDGKVVADYTKESIKSRKLGSITKIDETTLSIDNSKGLSMDDLKVINDFIKSSESEILLSKDTKQIKAYKKVAKISEFNDRESFVTTDENNIKLPEYSNEDRALIRSRLPLRHAAKIGISSLRLKPARLAFTIILSAVAFIFLAIVSTMTFYNKSDVTLRSLMNSSNQYINVQKSYYARLIYDENYTQEANFITNFSQDDKVRLISEYGSDTILYYTFNGIAPVGQATSNEGHIISNAGGQSNTYYDTSIMGFANLDSSHLLIKNLLAGNYPTADDQILISSYTFDSIKHLGLRDENRNAIPINAYSDIIGKPLYLRGSSSPVYVCGVFNVDNLIAPKYKDIATNINSTLVYEWETERKTNVYSLAITSEGFYDRNKKELMINANIATETPTSEITLSGLTLSLIGQEADFDLYKFNTSNINQDIVYVSPVAIYTLIQDNMVKNEELAEALNDLQNDLYLFAFGESLIDESIVASDEQRIAAFNKVYAAIEEANATSNVFENVSLVQSKNGVEKLVTIGGYSLDSSESILIVNSQMFKELYTQADGINVSTNYKIDKNAIYAGAFIYNSRSSSMFKKLLAEYENRNDDDSIININNSVFSSIEYVDSFFEIMTNVFLYAGIVLALFSTLLLFSFISMSITSKQREIGILRAIGARGKDVFKIFFSESLVIVMACLVISLISSYFACEFINKRLGEGLNGVSLLVFGGKSCALLVILAIVVCFISTFLPVYKIAKRKPVESIKSL